MGRGRQVVFRQGDVRVIEAGDRRYLQFGETDHHQLYQSMMQPSLPERVVSETIRRLCLLACLSGGREALVLGLGGGAAARALWAAGFEVTAVENNPDVLAAVGHMGGRDHIRVIEGDAEEHLTGPSVDALIVNLFDAQGMAPCLERQSFWSNACCALSREGVMAANLTQGHQEAQEALVMDALAPILRSGQGELCDVPGTYNRILAYSSSPWKRAAMRLAA